MGNNSSKLLAIKLSVSLGKQLKKPSYRIASAYTRGYSQALLADRIRKLPEYSSYERDTLAHAIRYALIGNDNPDLGPVYGGLIPRDVYEEHSRKHRQNSGIESGNQRLKERRGIHGLDSVKLRDCALKAAVARGETPWSRNELSAALGLALYEMFKLNGNVSYSSIANTLNQDYYGGREIRTNVSVREALRRLQRSFSKTKV